MILTEKNIRSLFPDAENASSGVAILMNHAMLIDFARSIESAVSEQLDGEAEQMHHSVVAQANAEIARLSEEFSQFRVDVDGEVNSLRESNAELLEGLKHARHILPAEKWADDTKKMCDALIAKHGGK